MKITEASNELYNSLREYDEVVGTGVEVKSNVNYIVVYLAKATDYILNKIPSEYRGNRVKTEVSGHFYSF